MMKHAVSLLLLLASLVLFTACKREGADTTDTAATAGDVGTDTATATHPGSPGGTALVPDVSAGTTVLVVVTEGSIAVKGESIPPGPAVLTIQNGGKEVHNLFIEGAGISRAAGDTIAEGGTATVDVTFQPGTYTFYCPVLNHREKGEQTTVTIGGVPGTATETTATTTAGTT